MERRQKWLESQFRRHDECLSKMAKQLQVLQDFISLNFDSYRQYALEREREETISNWSYGNSGKYHDDILPDYQQHGSHQRVTNLPLEQFSKSRLIPLPAPDTFQSGHRNISSHTTISESDYDDGDTMDPAPGKSDISPCGTGQSGGLLAIAAVDLSTSSADHQQSLYNIKQEQEPNSTTVSEYLQGTSESLPDSALVDEEPTDLTTERNSFGDTAYQLSSSSGFGLASHGSILGGILTSNFQSKTKEMPASDDSGRNSYAMCPRSRTASTESSSKDKEYSSQSLWSAGTVTTLVGDVGASHCRSGSVCSIPDEVTEGKQQIMVPTKRGRKNSSSKIKKALKEPKTEGGAHSSLEKLKKGGRGRYKRNKHSLDESNTSSVASSSAAPTSGSSPSNQEYSASTTTGSGRKSKGGGGGGEENVSKMCRFCGKTFQWLHSVKTHERLHTGIKPYACKICSARFTQNGNLKVHAKTCVEKHGESYRSRNVLICSVCTEMFSETDALMDHQKSHDRMQWTIKEKTCQLCGEVFQKRSFLLEHEKVHVQDRSFLSSLGIEAEVKGSSSSGSISSQRASHTPPSSSTNLNTDSVAVNE